MHKLKTKGNHNLSETFIHFRNVLETFLESFQSAFLTAQ